QPQLEDLEEADRAGADDDGVRVDHSAAQRMRWSSLPVLSAHSSASGSGALRLVMLGQFLARSALSWMYTCWSAGTSSSGTMALTGHSGMHTAQSMHSSGSMVRKFGPSRKQSTGHTSTQSVYLHLMQASVTTWVMSNLLKRWRLLGILLGRGVGLLRQDGRLRCRLGH